MDQNDCQPDAAAYVYPGAAGKSGTAGANGANGANGVNGANGANGDNVSPDWGNADAFALHVNADNWSDGLTHLLEQVFNALSERKSKQGQKKK
ncbi:hypothetical protein A7K91_09820 [Paenibacillus oryzae]|uniref:Collagen-like protein n=1 Tax=Paenibacillus oryzae TaxID=1844972 RepID=A0A1A5YSF1_9BACL|nr:hypothetical protein [Paenibacillus oryzae]OBR68488.1 hypothetical protein A7K91_09820 [Paenibacillus oryzae]